MKLPLANEGSKKAREFKYLLKMTMENIYSFGL